MAGRTYTNLIRKMGNEAKRAKVAAGLKKKAIPGRPTGKNSKLVAGVKSRAQGRAASGGKMKATPTRKKKQMARYGEDI